MFEAQPRSRISQLRRNHQLLRWGCVGLVFAFSVILLLFGANRVGPDVRDFPNLPLSTSNLLASEKTILTIATWNVAAINNNPFEYWITYENEDYKNMMEDVQDFVNKPGVQDIAVRKVFTDMMFSELKGEMQNMGWHGLDLVETIWKEDYSKRKIVSGFLKDGMLGLKRLTSMPDRVTNTMAQASGETIYRPTVINCYDTKIKSLNDWWTQWKAFMFRRHLQVSVEGEMRRPAEMLKKISRAKYPAIEPNEEEISIPLQTLAGAILDSIFVHMMFQVAPKTWQDLRGTLCHSLNLKKNERTLEILEKTYVHSDIIFMQEVAESFIHTLKKSALMERFMVYDPEKKSRSNQNSIILLNRRSFKDNESREITSLLEFEEQGKVADGDVFVLETNDFVLASFHGDTNGIQTIPVTRAVKHLAEKQNLETGHTRRLIFGLDANTYEHADKTKQDVLEFARYYQSLGLTSCWGDTPDPTQHTTYNGRTFLQPQLNKAAKKSEIISKGDVNPKDFILFERGRYVSTKIYKDNTGEKRFIENMVFPTLSFPSDHAILSALIFKQT